MDRIRLQHYRCLEDTGYLSVKPITILVGANSSGKSSFLKYFALLKQSVSSFVQGVFLWNGPLVDFRDFDNTVSSGQKTIEVEFTINSLPIVSSFRFSKKKIEKVNIHLILGKLDDNEHEDFLKEMSITYDDNHIKLYFHPNRKADVDVNGIKSNDLNDTLIWGLTNSLFPKFMFKSKNHGGDEENSYNAYKEIQETIKNYIDDEDQINRFVFLGNRLRNFFDKESMEKTLKRQSKDKIDNESIQKIYNMAMYFNINVLLDSLNLYMLSFAKKMTYVKPLRAIVERYYRYNNYAVDSIDADGSNIPMFLNSLSDDALNDFNEHWLLPIFGFTIKLKPSGNGHVEMIVIEKGKVERNLIDVGFGFTQVLPILTIIWKSIMVDCVNSDESEDFCQTHFVAIEQPELHLHPRFQGMFVDMLDRVVRICHKEKKDVRIIIETHSETIVNRIGTKIADEKSYLKPTDVNVLLFNGKHEGLDKYIESTSYDDDGYLVNWPFGFFSDYVDRD
jgi:predicted ATPase